jgi:hypothetical protein
MTIQFFNLINSSFIENNTDIINQFVEVLNNNSQFYRILTFMKDSILGLSVEKNTIQKINDILNNFEYTYVIHQKQNPGIVCLKLISNLSRNS